MSIRHSRLIVLLSLMLLLAFAPMANAAIVTHPFASFGGDSVLITFDRNEGNGNVIAFDCTNDSDYDAWLGVFEMDYTQSPPGETLLGEAICESHDSFSVPVPGVTITWNMEDEDGDGEPDGGLEMGNLQIRARWPHTE